MDNNGRGRYLRYPRRYGYCYWEANIQPANHMRPYNYSGERGLRRPYPYYRGRGNYRGFPNKTLAQNLQKSRSSSPVEGSEEFTNRKIEQTSAIIMRHLLTSEEIVLPKTAQMKNKEAAVESEDQAVNSSSKKNKVVKKQRKSSTRSNEGGQGSSVAEYDIQELHHKILSHITNMNESRKKNLINAEVSGFDEAIRQIQKQKRLEISRALRNMCNSTDADTAKESSNLINSIIPDVGIKIEDLPIDVIRALRETLGLDDEDEFSSQNFVNFENNLEIKEEREDEDFLRVEMNFEGSQSNKDESSQNHVNFENEVEIKIEDEDEGFLRLEINFEESQSKKDTDESNSNNENVTTGQTSVNNLSGPTSEIELENSLIPIKIENTENDFEYGNNIDNTGSKDPSTEENQSNSINSIELQEKNDFVNSRNSFLVSDDNVSHNISELSLHKHANSNEIDMETDDTTVFKQNTSESIPLHSNISIDKSSNHANSRNSSDFIPLNSSKSSNSASSKKCDPEQIVFNVDSQNNLLNTTLDNDSYRNEGKVPSIHTENTVLNIDMEVQNFFDDFKTKYGRCDVIDLPNVVNKMRFVDKCVEKLTTFRQSLFDELVQKNAENNKIITDDSQNSTTVSPRDELVENRELISTDKPQVLPRKRKFKRGVEKSTTKNDLSRKKRLAEFREHMKMASQAIIKKVKPLSNKNGRTQGENKVEKREKGEIHDITFPTISDNVTQIRVHCGRIYLGTQNGLVYIGPIKTGIFTNVLQNDGRVVTCLDFYKNSKLYVGTDLCLRVFHLQKSLTSNLITINITGRIQCIDVQSDWNCLFLGCKNGSIIRISTETGKIESEVETSHEIRTLVSTKEGPRKVLIVGNKDGPIVVRDAMSCLILRALTTNAVTTNSIILKRNLVLCGTTNKSILVYIYQEGVLFKNLEVESKGVTCLKAFKGCVFAGCTDGSLYIFKSDANNSLDFIYRTKFAGGSILCMAPILPREIIVKTMKKPVVLFSLPDEVVASIIG